MESFKVLAPTRADLAGGTLDLWPLYCILGEAKTINVALNLRVAALFEVSASPSFRVEITLNKNDVFTFSEPMDKAQIKLLKPALKFPVFVISRYLEERSTLPKSLIQIKLQSEAPMGSGLGGSSTLCVAIIRGLAKVFGDFIEQGWQWRMLHWVRDVEAAYLCTPTGTQDYLAALFGGIRCYTSRIGGIDSSPYSSGVLEQFSERLVVLFSGEMHQSQVSNWEVYRQAMEGHEEVNQGLLYLKQVADQLDGELRSGHLSWKYIGQCLNEEWQIRKKMFRVETPRLNEIISFLADNNVLGAKVCGAAQGGSLIALVEPSAKAKLVEKCQSFKMQVLPSTCAKEGVVVVQ
jgi:D-glycero-alpha-D-manno-heptose-7-phosphate kinase